jgi:hypothetical protein
LAELRKPAEAPPPPVVHPRNFSISKLVAGIVQILALAIFASSYWAHTGSVQTFLLIAIMAQLFTVALLIMDKQQ